MANGLLSARPVMRSFCIFYDETDICLFLLDSLDREHQSMQTVWTLYPTTGFRLGPHFVSLQYDRTTCSRTQVPFTIYVLGNQLSYVKLDDITVNFVALHLLFTAYKHRKQSCLEHVKA